MYDIHGVLPLERRMIQPIHQLLLYYLFIQNNKNLVLNSIQLMNVSVLKPLQ